MNEIFSLPTLVCALTLGLEVPYWLSMPSATVGPSRAVSFPNTQWWRREGPGLAFLSSPSKFRGPCTCLLQTRGLKAQTQCHPDLFPVNKSSDLSHILPLDSIASCNLSTLYLPDKKTGIETGSNLYRTPQGLRGVQPTDWVLSWGPLVCGRIFN